jgi:hypothetical protein
VGTKTLYKDPNTDAFAVGSDGRVVGCRVDILKAEDTPPKKPLTAGTTVYRVVSLRFLNEEQSDGDTSIRVSVVDRAGVPATAKVIFAWPQQTMPRWDGTVSDWATPDRAAAFPMGSGNFSPDRDGPLGPYVVYVEQDQAQQMAPSDWCIGFGLPGNRHVAYRVMYQECLAYQDDVYGPDSPPIPPAPPTPPPTPPPSRPGGCNLLAGAVAKALGKFRQ